MYPGRNHPEAVPNNENKRRAPLSNSQLEDIVLAHREFIVEHSSKINTIVEKVNFLLLEVASLYQEKVDRVERKHKKFKAAKRMGKTQAGLYYSPPDTSDMLKEIIDQDAKIEQDELLDIENKENHTPPTQPYDDELMPIEEETKEPCSKRRGGGATPDYTGPGSKNNPIDVDEYMSSLDVDDIFKTMNLK